jgi:hypothetical protein
MRDQYIIEVLLVGFKKNPNSAEHSTAHHQQWYLDDGRESKRISPTSRRRHRLAIFTKPLLSKVSLLGSFDIHNIHAFCLFVRII